MTRDPDQGLGALQRQVLVWLYQQTMQARAWAAALPETAVTSSGDVWRPREYCLRRVAVWGISWQTLPHDMRASPSQKSAVSTALRRLEERGLVLRENQRSGAPRESADEPHIYTTHVRLTEAGKQVAAWVTDELA